jgi:hypothetical protein
VMSTRSSTALPKRPFRVRAITTWSIHRRRRGQQNLCCTRLSALQAPGTHSRHSCNHASPSQAFHPAVESPAGAGSAGISDVARLEIHTQTALQNTSFNDTYLSALRLRGGLRRCGACEGVGRIAAYRIKPVRLGDAQLRQYCFYASSGTRNQIRTPQTELNGVV